MFLARLRRQMYCNSCCTFEQIHCISHAEFRKTLCPIYSKFDFLHFSKLHYSCHLLATNLWSYVHLNVWKIEIKGIKILSIYFTKALCPKARPYVQKMDIWSCCSIFMKNLKSISRT